MAYASWVTPKKNGQVISGGSGDDTVSWEATEHTGRLVRTTYAKFTASEVEDKTLTIHQSGALEFVDMDDIATISKTGGTVTISGYSNSSKLTFSKANDGIGLTIPSSYTANGITVSNGAAITGDPGASAKFAFSITFANIGANTGAEAKTAQLTVTADGGQSDTCTITQAAADAYLTISPTEITIPAAGTAQSVSVSSNTSWNIS